MAKDGNFSKRIAIWRAAFEDEITGIHRTLDDLIWDYAAFRTAVRIVNLAGEERTDDALVNRMLFDLVAKGYWSGLLLGVRRLLDGAAIGGERGVYSLRSVLNDVKACRHHLTRRIYVEQVCDAEYDLERLREEQYQELIARAGKPTWGKPDIFRSELAHKNFDDLSGVRIDERTPNDLIEPVILERVEARLKRLNSICDHVSTHLAHAGNEESRRGKLLDKFDIRDAQNALRELKQVADLIGRWFANASGAGLATPQYDQFEGLDRVLVAPSQLKVLEENWEKIEREVESWSLQPEDL